MRKILAVTALLVASAPVLAADNGIVWTPGTGGTSRSKDVGALVQQPFVGLGNDAGTSLIGAGSTVPVSGNVGFVGTPTVVANQGGTWTVQQGTPPWPISVADGIDVTQGAKGDGVCGSDIGTCSIVALMKRINQNLAGPIPAGSNAIGSVTVSNANNNGRATSASSSPVVPSAAALSTVIVNSTGTTATSVKGTAGTLFSCQAGNTNATPVYIHIYNKAASAPVPGTDASAKILIVPGNTAGAGTNALFGPGGLAFSSGIGISINAGIGILDNSAVTAANTVVLNCDYE